MQIQENKENNNITKDNTQNFGVDYNEIQGRDGKTLKRLNARIEGKHFVGGLDERENKLPSGEVRKYTSANMKLCTGTHCRTCYPEILTY